MISDPEKSQPSKCICSYSKHLTRLLFFCTFLHLVYLFQGGASERERIVAKNRITNEIHSYPLVTIREIQEVPLDSLVIADSVYLTQSTRASLQVSPLLNDTVAIVAICVVPPKVLNYTAAGWTMILYDTTNEASWRGIEVRVSGDTTQLLADGFLNVQRGDVVRITGRVDEFPSISINSLTQFVPIPGNPITVIGSMPIPEPPHKSVSDFVRGIPLQGGKIMFSTGEQYESMIVFETNVTVSSIINLGRGTFAYVDNIGNVQSEYDASKWFTYDPSRHDPSGTYTWTIPPIGTILDTLRGWVSVGAGADNFRGYRMCPVYPGDVPLTGYLISAIAAANGSIMPNGALVDTGADKSFIITPNPGYHIDSVVIDGVNMGPIGSYIFTNVTANHTIAAYFSNLFAITTSTTANGTIIPSGVIVLSQGSSQSFTISANYGHRIDSVLIDGVNQGAISSYTFTNVSTNHTIAAFYSFGEPDYPYLMVDSLPNVYSMAKACLNPIAYDPDLDVLAFIYRGDGSSYAPSNGTLYYSYSTNGGTSWTRSQLMNEFDPDTIGARYPSCAIFNPSGTLSTASVFSAYPNLWVWDQTPSFGDIGFAVGNPLISGTNVSSLRLRHSTDTSFSGGQPCWSSTGSALWTSQVYEGQYGIGPYRGIAVFRTQDLVSISWSIISSSSSPICHFTFEQLGGDWINAPNGGVHAYAWIGDFYRQFNPVPELAVVTPPMVAVVYSTDDGSSWGQLDTVNLESLSSDLGEFTSLWRRPNNVGFHFAGDIVLDSLGYPHLVVGLQQEPSGEIGVNVVIAELYKDLTGWHGKIISPANAQTAFIIGELLDQNGYAPFISRNKQGTVFFAQFTSSDDINNNADLFLTARHLQSSAWIAPINVTSTPDFNENIANLTPRLRANGDGTYTVWSALTQTQASPPDCAPCRAYVRAAAITLNPWNNTSGQGGKLSGRKFNDLNANGVLDSGEPLIAHWKISAQRNPSSAKAAYTGATGQFLFSGLKSGTYIVTEVQPQGWIQTYPSARFYTATLGSNDSIGGFDFGNYLGGVVKGSVYQDVNQNGVRDSGDTPLSGSKIFLDPGPIDTVLADEFGKYEFVGVPVGSYTVRQEQRAFWVQTYPSVGGHSITVGVADTLDTLDFGIHYSPGATISGMLFNDVDGNGLQGLGETGLKGWILQLSPYDQYATTDPTGHYSFIHLPPGPCSLSLVIKENWIQTFPLLNAPHALLLSQDQIVTSVDFGSRINVDVQDLSIGLAGGVARPGFQTTYSLVYANAGTVMINAIVEFVHPVNTTLLDGSIVPNYSSYQPSTRTVRWDFPNFINGSEGMITLAVQISPPPIVNNGDSLLSYATINPIVSDVQPGNNQAAVIQFVGGSYDPNDKIVLPVGLGSENMIPVESGLMYEIRFQNTGTDTAFNVKLIDSLDANLDLRTLMNGPASHPNEMTISDGRKVSWKFDNINLPDSNVNERASHGFVTFTVKPKMSATGNEILNFADIFFDFNLPVRTNTVRTFIGIVDTLQFLPRWNLISLPYGVIDNRKEVLFPQATSGAFFFNGGYQEEDSLRAGAGYWLKFPPGAHSSIIGVPLVSESISVHQGWNMIGSLAHSIPVSFIRADVSGMFLSNVYGYDGQYSITDTLRPHKGYWVKTNQDGRLILADSGQLASQWHQVAIIATSEMPPEPPHEDHLILQDIPREFMLEQAYPSPFNPTTTIRYQLPIKSQIKLEIYNTLGQVVQVLVNDVENEGVRTIRWNATSFPSGIYFYRLEATSVSDPTKTFTQTRKMVLMK